MAQLTEESLLEAIKKDDIKAFNALMEKARCGLYRLGRFPVLSLMYLYGARQLISAYEEKFIKVPGYEELREPVEVSSKFAKKAGKCLRLYLNEVVTPLEMLLILDDTRRLRRIYPQTKPSSAVKGRLQSVYSIRYSLGVKFMGDNIVLDKKPLSGRAKRNIAIICACSVFAVSVAVGVPVTVNEFKVDFSSRKEITLKRDIVISKPIKEVNCKLIGNGHKITLKNGATLGECKGSVSDLTIESNGGAVFTTVYESAVVKDITLKVNADMSVAESTAFVAVTNYGWIGDVMVEVSGKLTALAPATAGESLTFGGIVQTNAYKNDKVRGVIDHCTVNYSSFSLVGEQTADASFGGLAGINNSYVQYSTVTGEITADTFDLAGVCSVNNGVISYDENEATLTQISTNTGWSPMVGGIVLTNNSDVVGCKNNGAITVDGVGEARVGGIAAVTYGAAYYFRYNAELVRARVYNCLSSGDITVKAAVPSVGGIAGRIEVEGEYIDGVLVVYYGVVDSCISESNISVTVTGDANAFVGGVAGFVREASITGGESTIYLGGSVNNCYFTGKCQASVKYFGNIVGVCGAGLYESNSYTSGNVEYHNFDGNYYLSGNSLTAFGATVATVDDKNEYAAADDKGATALTIEEIKETENYKAILKVFEG